MSSPLAGCPDSNTLATYLDAALSEAERLAVQQHIAGCPRCLDALAEVMQFTDADDREQRWTTASWSRSFSARRHTVAGSLATSIAVVLAAFVAIWWAGRITLDPTSSLDSVYVSHGRFLEGRLSGETVYRPWMPDALSMRPIAIQEALTKARTDVTQAVAADQLHAYGVFGALAGDWDAAAFALAAARDRVGDARFHGDAAAIYVERARQTGRAADLVRALGSAERALRLDPSLMAPRFNRALALDRLSLRPQARSAWIDYLLHDATSGWAGEARNRVVALEAPLAERWTEVETALRRRVEPLLAEEAIRDHTTEARRFLETVLLPEWAAAVATGTWAATEHEGLRVMADGFARLTGDILYQDTLRVIDHAEARGGATLRALAAAHAGYAAAAALLWRDQFAAAESGLATAVRAFAKTGSPFLVRARLDTAVVAQYMGQHAAAAQTLEDTASEADRRAYLFVNSRAHWVQGLGAFGAGRYAEARLLWESMLDLATRMGDAEEQAAAHGLLANLLDHLADDDAAWRHRVAYLETLSNYRADRIRFGLLISAAGHALREDPAAALTLQALVLEEAIRSRRDGALPEAYAQRAEICAALGWSAEATRDITAAWATWNGLSDATLKARLEPSLRAAEVRVLERLKDPYVGPVAERAIAGLLARGEHTGLAGLYGALSRARLRAGRLHDAAAAAEAGMRALQRAGRGAPLATNGGDERAALFEIAMRVALARKDFAAAYAYGAVARSRTPLLEPESLQKLENVQGLLENDEALIALNQLDEQLVVWLVRPSEVQFRIVKLTRLESERLVSVQQDEIALEAEQPQASAALFHAIVRPFAPRLANVERVAVSPDTPFFGASFPALFDRTTGRFWIEDADLMVVASTNNGEASAAPARRMVVQVPSNATRDVAIALWREALGNAVVQLGIPVTSNNLHPELSRIGFADESGFPHSGALLARDLKNLPPAAAVFLPHIDPGPLPATGAGSFDAARAFLDSEIPYVVTSVVASSMAAASTAELRKHLEGNVSITGAVAGFQREALRLQHRLGKWSHLVVYGVGY